MKLLSIVRFIIIDKGYINGSEYNLKVCEGVLQQTAGSNGDRGTSGEGLQGLPSLLQRWA